MVIQKKERAAALPFDLVDVFLLAAQDHDQQRQDCRDQRHHRLIHSAHRIQAPNKAPAAKWARVSSIFCMINPFVALHTRGKMPKNTGFYLVACCGAILINAHTARVIRASIAAVRNVARAQDIQRSASRVALNVCTQLFVPFAHTVICNDSTQPIMRAGFAVCYWPAPVVMGAHPVGFIGRFVAFNPAAIVATLALMPAMQGI